ncbi:hypothetical protein BDF19DRAFT_466430 [Syncephalis fuscata]|nr:hypothetical protein BDF19DRAFT_466430 [Syncephalis fuscata]
MNSVKAIIAASILIIIGLASVDARPVSGHSPSIYATPQINQPTIYEQDSMVVTETMHPNGHASSSRRPLNLGEHIEGTITVREWVQDDIKHIETVEADGAQRLEKEPLVRRSVPGEATTIVTKENDTITTHVIEADGSESSSIRTLDPEENSEDFVEIYDPINNYGSPYNKENLVRRSNNGVTTTRITDKNGWVTSLVKNLMAPSHLQFTSAAR